MTECGFAHMSCSRRHTITEPSPVWSALGFSGSLYSGEKLVTITSKIFDLHFSDDLQSPLMGEYAINNSMFSKINS